MVEPESSHTYVLAQARWSIIFVLLSMDVVVPFYDLMGFMPHNAEAFRDLLRVLILELRRSIESNSAPAAKFTPEWFIERIGAEFGTTTSNHVAWWGRFVFDFSLDDHRSLDAWTNVFRYAGNDPTLWKGVPPDLRSDTLLEFKRSLDVRTYKERLQEIDGRPLSDWDLHVYAIQGFDDQDPAAPNGPRTYILPTVKTYQAYRFWAWLLKGYRREDLEILFANALAVSKEPKNAPLMSEICKPDLLDIGS
jgi:hypothetical protein